jgi:hypothetical protein
MKNNKNSIEDLKNQYDSIKIPEEELQKAMQDSIIRAEAKESKRKNRNRWIHSVGISAAAALVLLTISINTMPVVADSLEEIPGLGKLVSILNFNHGDAQGGIITDGSDISVINVVKNKNKDHIIIHFAQNGTDQSQASSYKINYSETPYTMTFSIGGARKISAEQDFENLKKSTLIQDAYKIITLDDSMQRFSITFRKPVLYEVKEYKEPAQLVVTITEDQPKEKMSVYSVRTASYPFGETLGIVDEMLMDQPGRRILKDQNGTFCVEVACFTNEADANNKLKELKERMGPDTMFIIEKRNAEDIPKEIK